MTVTVDAVVVNYSRSALLRDCLDSVRVALHQVPGSGQLIVVDNASSDDSVSMVQREFPEATLVPLKENRGFAGGVECGLAHARGEWVLLLNNDATIARDAIVAMLDVAGAEPTVGGVAAVMRFATRPGVINSAGIGVDRLGVAYDRLLGKPIEVVGNSPREVFGASGGAALLRRAMLDEIGGFDATFFAFLEDVDLAWRARMLGWKTMLAPKAIVDHHHSATAGHRSHLKHFLVGRNRVRVLAKNADGRLLLRYGAWIAFYELGYLAYAVVRHRSLAPVQGRLAGIREWRRYRRRGAGIRRSIDLEPVRGFRSALQRNRAWS